MLEGAIVFLDAQLGLKALLKEALAEHLVEAIENLKVVLRYDFEFGQDRLEVHLLELNPNIPLHLQLLEQIDLLHQLVVMLLVGLSDVFKLPLHVTHLIVDEFDSLLIEELGLIVQLHIDVAVLRKWLDTLRRAECAQPQRLRRRSRQLVLQLDCLV